MFCTRCDGTGFLNIHQLPDDIDINDVNSVLLWVDENKNHNVSVCDCCGNGEYWYSEPGEHDIDSYVKEFGCLPDCYWGRLIVQDMFEEKYEWKCLICGEKLEIIYEGDDKIGHFPCLSGGGIIQAQFGYGSTEYDDMVLPGTWQAAIHDECFKKLEDRARRVLVRNIQRFDKPDEIS